MTERTEPATATASAGPRVDGRTAAAASTAPTSLWRRRNFMMLWTGQAVSEVGSAVTQIALPLTALLLLDATAFQVGLLTAATTAAYALLALPAGAIVDRHAKRPLMIVCDVARLVLIGSIPVAAAAGVLTLVQLYVVAVTPAWRRSFSPSPTPATCPSSSTANSSSTATASSA